MHPKLIVSCINHHRTAQKEADMKESNEMNTGNTGSMDIKVTVTPMQNQDGCLKANASFILNGAFKVTGIRIGISQKGNIFVSMPDYKTFPAAPDSAPFSLMQSYRLDSPCLHFLFIKRFQIPGGYLCHIPLLPTEPFHSAERGRYEGK